MWGHVFDQLASYAEEQLSAGDRARVERHLGRCERCRAALAEVQAGVAMASMLTAEPMPDDVVASIRERIGGVHQDVVGTTKVVPSTQVGVMPSIARPAGGHDFSRAGSTWLRTARWQLAAAAVVLIGVTVLFWHVNRPWIRLEAATAPPTRFEADGQALHERIISGQLPLAFRSDDEQALWGWLAGQGAPVTSMQITRPDIDRDRFVPVGAAVQTLDRATTSVLAYRIDGHPVTLALARTGEVPDAPAAGWWSKRVAHRTATDGSNTLTWTVGGGTYVMVSELEGAGQGACLICHTTPRFRQAVSQLSISAPVDRR